MIDFLFDPESTRFLGSVVIALIIFFGPILVVSCAFDIINEIRKDVKKLLEDKNKKSKRSK